MSSNAARTEILSRIRSALSDLPEAAASNPAETPVKWTYGASVSTGDLGLVDRFAERVADYRAVVEQIPADALPAAIGTALAAVDGGVIAAPSLREGVPSISWIDDDTLTPAQLDAVGAVVTTATVGIANTGTIVLDHDGGQGRRAVSLVPDVHICVIRADQVVSDVPEAVAALIASGADVRPQTWISSPSATSDIELDRVEGVHGPRTLHVIITR